jgi:hypothetical protein
MAVSRLQSGTTLIVGGNLLLVLAARGLSLSLLKEYWVPERGLRPLPTSLCCQPTIPSQLRLVSESLGSRRFYYRLVNVIEESSNVKRCTLHCKNTFFYSYIDRPTTMFYVCFAINQISTKDQHAPNLFNRFNMH